ncbi:MAG: winged helix DNA-binding protein [Candidatus Hodarchaeota archaeon]
MVYLFPVTGSKQKIRISRSAVAVLELLENKKMPLAVREIKEELPYSERTIHYALQQLREKAFVAKNSNFEDLRESRYFLTSKAALFGFRITL